MKTRFRTLLAAASILLAWLALGASAWGQGFVYEAVQTLDPDRGKDQTQWQVRAWVDGESAKIQFDESTNPVAPKGSYLLTTDGGETLLLVDPKEETYAEWDLNALFAVFGSLMEGLDGVFNLDFEDVTSETLERKAGPEILGYPTTHVRSRTAYTMKMKAMGMRRQWTVDSVTDAWTTDEIDMPGMFVWLRSDPPSTGDEELDAMIRAEIERSEGLALRMETTTTNTDQKGRARTSKSTMEITKLEAQSIEPSTFEIPAGYRQVDPAEDPSSPAGLSSLFKGRG